MMSRSQSMDDDAVRWQAIADDLVHSFALFPFQARQPNGGLARLAFQDLPALASLAATEASPTAVIGGIASPAAGRTPLQVVTAAANRIVGLDELSWAAASLGAASVLGEPQRGFVTESLDRLAQRYGFERCDALSAPAIAVTPGPTAEVVRSGDVLRSAAAQRDALTGLSA